MNFKRTLSGNRENIPSLKHSTQKRITKYFFQKKKSYKFHRFFKKQLSYVYTNVKSNRYYLLSTRERVTQHYNKFPLKFPKKKRAKGKRNPKNSIVLLRSPQNFNKHYLTLKSHLKYPKHIKKKLSTITKKLGRQNTKQFRYSHVF